jgi:hypothetical protein
MNFPSIASGLIVALSLSVAVRANPHQLDTLSYNFQLAGGGGGSTALIDGSLNVEIFCIDFANDIYVPHNQYSANLTSVTSGSDLSLTRFGLVTSWTPVVISGDPAHTAIINTADALARYQMAAFLISTYDLSANPTSNAFNNGIQEAVWEIMHPAVALEPDTPHLGDPSSALVAGAEWLANVSVSARDAFLASYKIVTDATPCAGATTGCGFQEQMTDPPAETPEPRLGALILTGLLLCGVLLQRSRRAAASLL